MSNFLPITEAAAQLGVSYRTLTRVISRSNIPTQLHTVPKPSGGVTHQRWVDVVALAAVLGKPHPKTQPLASLPPTPKPSTTRTPTTADLDRRLQLQHVRALPYGQRGNAIAQLAREWGVSPRHIQRLLQQPERESRVGGAPTRLPAEMQSLLTALWLEHPGASAERIRRIIEINDPALLKYRPHPNSTEFNTLSAKTILRFRRHLEAQPEMRYALLDDKQRREFRRVWSGSVLAAHPNELWIGDMTRCDTFVYDPARSTRARMRIHAIIDAFSGAIPAMVFSFDENQRASDQMLMLGLTPKPNHANWPIYGTPKTLYLDNGKTYTSAQFEKITTALAIELRHSLPRVSHTRGQIERFFGEFHRSLEAQLPGYAGPNTVARDNELLVRLERNTVTWLASGARPESDPLQNPDPTRRRLLLPNEFKSAALAWLTADYHHRGVDAPAKRFAAHAPPATLIAYQIGDLNAIFSIQHRRVVRGNGTVEFRNQRWHLPDGSLVAHQGREVVILENQIFPDEPLRVAVLERKSLVVLGALELEPTNALSPEAVAARHARRGVVRQIAARAAEIHQTLGAPQWGLGPTLERLSGLTPPPPTKRIELSPSPAPGTRAELARSAQPPSTDQYDAFEAAVAALGDALLDHGKSPE